MNQNGVDVQVIVADDCSTDTSCAIARSFASSDPRVICLEISVNGGPAAARNAALDHARGDWIAVLDSDDLIHPDRSIRLIQEAVESGAHIVADDLILFDDAGAMPTRSFLQKPRTRQAHWIGLADYLGDTVMYGRRPNLGFLKPVMNRLWMAQAGLRYDPRLHIAEDDDLIVQALLAGARYRIMPEPLYFYRKHGHSISHRLSPQNADRMVSAIDRIAPSIASCDDDVRRAWRHRSRSIASASAFAHMVAAIKSKNLSSLVRLAAQNPRALTLFRQPLLSTVRRLVPKTKAPRPPRIIDPDAVMFLSRQRLIGATNGSSTYLIALAKAARDAGLKPHLIQPSAGLFGRTPFFKLRPEMAVFESTHIRTALALGQWRVTTQPSIWLGAVRAVVSRIASRLGIIEGWFAERKAPYAIAAPWTNADRMFVTDQGRNLAATILADYVFQVEALPYLVQPDKRVAIVMHDLFSARHDQFATSGQSDSVTMIDRATEIDALRRADAVIAIQPDEAKFIADNVPGASAILAMMAADVVACAQPGSDDHLLFVGSNTAPNVHGLEWFVAQVWPMIKSVRPACVLDVAGTVAQGIAIDARDVRMLGMVDDLAPLYAQAGVVISPLLQGSGLKIKLVEALSHGKAAVVTGVTLQGVSELLGDAVQEANTPETFAAAVIALLGDTQERAALADRALVAARSHFGPQAVFAEFTDWLKAPLNREEAG